MSYATGCHTVFHHRYLIVWVCGSRSTGRPPRSRDRRTEIAGGGRDDCALRGPYAELDKGLLLALRHAIEGLKKAHCPQYARRWRGTIGPGRSVRRLLPAGWSSRLRWRPTVSPARPGSDRLSGAKNWLAT